MKLPRKASLLALISVLIGVGAWWIIDSFIWSPGDFKRASTKFKTVTLTNDERRELEDAGIIVPPRVQNVTVGKTAGLDGWLTRVVRYRIDADDPIEELFEDVETSLKEMGWKTSLRRDPGTENPTLLYQKGGLLVRYSFLYGREQSTDTADSWWVDITSINIPDPTPTPQRRPIS